MDEPPAERGFTPRRRKASAPDYMTSNQTHSFIVTVPERESNATYMIEKMELPNPTVVDAVLTKSLSYEALERNGDKHPAFDLNLSKYAVHLSHQKALRKCIESKAERCLILEDDIDADEAGTKWKNVDVTRAADIFFYGRGWEGESLVVDVDDKTVRTYSPLCRHAMLVTPHAAKILANTTLISEPGDHIVASLCRGVFKCYAASPPVVNQSRQCSFCLSKNRASQSSSSATRSYFSLNGASSLFSILPEYYSFKLFGGRLHWHQIRFVFIVLLFLGLFIFLLPTILKK